jgi:hypothetical protein
LCVNSSKAATSSRIWSRSPWETRRHR